MLRRMGLPVKFKLEEVNVPEKFNPEIHCGAYKANGHTVCMLKEGTGTNHLGTGRCKFHGGASSKTLGAKLTSTLEERMEQFQNSPELLSVDRSVAFLQAFVEQQFAMYGQSLDTWNEVREALAQGTKDGEPPAITQDMFPQLDTKAIDQLGKMVTIAFNMRYAKRNAISVPEMQAMVGQIVVIFQQLVEKYHIPRDAAAEFAQRLRTLRTANTGPDPQLDHALNPRPQIEAGIIDERDDVG